MLFSSFQKRIQAMDVYRKVPKGLAQATYSGAIISMVSIMLMLFLFLSEFRILVNYKYNTELSVDDRSPHKQSRINLTIYFKQCNCYVLQTQHSNNKYLDKNIKEYQDVIKSVPGPRKQDLDIISNEELLKKFDNKDGCIFHYSSFSDQVPNVFKITPFSRQYSIYLFKQFELGLIKVNMEHIILSLKFGDQENQEIQRQLIDDNTQNPLNGHQSHSDDHNNVQYEYFLNVVPAKFFDFDGKQESFFQYTSQSQNFQTDKFPVVELRYDFSPITINYIQDRERFYQFIVQVCAIVGGIFTIAGIIDAIVHQSVIKITQKNQIGKLS